MEEKIFVINLRRELLRVPRQQKSKRALSTIREYLKRHMKAKEIKIGDSINKEIWSGSDWNPPGKLKIKAIKNDEDVVVAELFGEVFEEELTKTVETKKTEEEAEKNEEESEKPSTNK